MGANNITNEEKKRNREEFIAIWFLNNPNSRKKVYAEKDDESLTDNRHSSVPMAVPVKKKVKHK